MDQNTKEVEDLKIKIQITVYSIHTTEDNLIDGEVGQHFHMDFGFVQGSEYRVKQEHSPTTTSIDGFNSYLIIMDRVTQYIWVFLTTSKSPPINLAQRVLSKFKSVNKHRTVRTDQGG